VHEYSIIQALMERVEAEAEARGAIAVDRLVVRIGELSGVEVELLRTAYMTFRERTICQRAALDIAEVPAQWSCRECGEPVARGEVLRCQCCGGPAELRQGDEIVLDRIEMEVA
jgi:hydrogenase nickel incorporation protein HypA/HybF